MLTISSALKKVLGAVLQSAQCVILSAVMSDAAVLLTFAPLTYQKHDALFLKLMKRRVPNELLTILDIWLSSCYLCGL